MEATDNTFTNALRDSILWSSTFKGQLISKFNAKWLADRNFTFNSDLINSFSNSQLFTAMGTFNPGLLVSKMDMSGVIDMGFISPPDKSGGYSNDNLSYCSILKLSL
jgi:hypothetical protein